MLTTLAGFEIVAVTNTSLLDPIVEDLMLAQHPFFQGNMLAVHLSFEDSMPDQAFPKE